jgi:hypothetical protein
MLWLGLVNPSSATALLGGIAGLAVRAFLTPSPSVVHR